MHKIPQNSEIEKFDEEHKKVELKNALNTKLGLLDRGTNGIRRCARERRAWWWSVGGDLVGDAVSRAGESLTHARSGRGLWRRVWARAVVAGDVLRPAWSSAAGAPDDGGAGWKSSPEISPKEVRCHAHTVLRKILQKLPFSEQFRALGSDTM